MWNTLQRSDVRYAKIRTMWTACSPYRNRWEMYCGYSRAYFGTEYTCIKRQNTHIISPCAHSLRVCMLTQVGPTTGFPQNEICTNRCRFLSVDFNSMALKLPGAVVLLQTAAGFPPRFLWNPLQPFLVAFRFCFMPNKLFWPNCFYIFVAFL